MTRYLYATTAVALTVFYIAVVVTLNALLRLLGGMESDLQTRQTLATGLGITVVTGPLWWLHWRGLQWQIAREPALQKGYRTYLFMVAGLAIFVIFISAGASVTILMRLALGLLPDATAGWAQGLPCMVALVMAALIWWRHWSPLMNEERIAHPVEPRSGRSLTTAHSIHG
jgi:hypothetical protein